MPYRYACLYCTDPAETADGPRLRCDPCLLRVIRRRRLVSVTASLPGPMNAGPEPTGHWTGHSDRSDAVYDADDYRQERLARLSGARTRALAPTGMSEQASSLVAVAQLMDWPTRAVASLRHVQRVVDIARQCNPWQLRGWSQVGTPRKPEGSRRRPALWATLAEIAAGRDVTDDEARIVQLASQAADRARGVDPTARERWPHGSPAIHLPTASARAEKLRRDHPTDLSAIERYYFECDPTASAPPARVFQLLRWWLEPPALPVYVDPSVLYEVAHYGHRRVLVGGGTPTDEPPPSVLAGVLGTDKRRPYRVATRHLSADPDADADIYLRQARVLAGAPYRRDYDGG